MGAFGADYLLAKIKLPDMTKKYAAVGLVTVILGVNFMVNLPAMNSIDYKKPKKVPFDREFRHEIGNKFEIYDIFLRNHGSLMAPWLSAYKDSRALVAENNVVYMDYVIQGELTVNRRNYTPNRVEYDFTASSGGTILFGIGYDEGWYAGDGRELFENNGLVATKFSRGDRHLTLRYRTPYFYSGLFVSLLALAGCVIVNINRNLGKRFKAIFD